MNIVIMANRMPLTIIMTAPRLSGFVKLGVVPGGGVRPGSWTRAGSSKEGSGDD